MGGLGPVSGCLASEFPSLRALACETLATALQNNPLVQTMASSANLLAVFLPMVTTDPDANVQAKALLALSSLVRDNVPATRSFLASDGLAAVHSCLSSSTLRLQRRALFFLRHLVAASCQCAPAVKAALVTSHTSLLALVAHFVVGEDPVLREDALCTFVEFLGEVDPVSADGSAGSGAGAGAGSGASASTSSGAAAVTLHTPPTATAPVSAAVTLPSAFSASAAIPITLAAADASNVTVASIPSTASVTPGTPSLVSAEASVSSSQHTSCAEVPPSVGPSTSLALMVVDDALPVGLPFTSVAAGPTLAARRAVCASPAVDLRSVVEQRHAAIVAASDIDDATEADLCAKLKELLASSE
jgi:hypothetical protein